jgi:hypothetical protein
MNYGKRLTAWAGIGIAGLLVVGWLVTRSGPEPAVARDPTVAQSPAVAQSPTVARASTVAHDAGGAQEDPSVAQVPAGQEAASGTDQEELTPAEEAILAHDTASLGPQQPLPFNHAFHTTELQMSCEYCHQGTDRSKVAVMPALSVCIGCHRVVGSGLQPIQELRAYWERGEPVPWERVYKLPEFAQFYHAPHLRNGVECAECHGPVDEMARIYQWSSLRMGWCLECHRGAPEETDVATDYMLNQQFEHPPMAEGRQPTGLYPYAISEEYGVSRGPIDCYACHY